MNHWKCCVHNNVMLPANCYQVVSVDRCNVQVFEQLTQSLLKQLEKESRGVLQATCTVEVSRYGNEFIVSPEIRQDTEIDAGPVDQYGFETFVRIVSSAMGSLGRVDEVYSFRVIYPDSDAATKAAFFV